MNIDPPATETVHVIVDTESGEIIVGETLQDFRLSRLSCAVMETCELALPGKINFVHAAIIRSSEFIHYIKTLLTE